VSDNRIYQTHQSEKGRRWSDADIDLTPLVKVPSSTPSYWLHHAPAGDLSGGVCDLLKVRGIATHVVECDVPTWLAAVVDLSEDENAGGSPDSDRKSWRVAVQEWCGVLSADECDLILSALLMRAGYLRQALNLAEFVLAKNNISFRARVFGALTCSRVLLAQEKRDRAVSVLHQAAGECPLDRDTVSLRVAEAKCYCHTSDHAKAERLIAEVARWSIDTDDWGAGAYCSLHYAESELATVGTSAKALQLVHGTERGMVYAGDFEGLIYFLQLLARVRVMLGDFDKAREHALRAHELVTIYKDAILLVNVTNHIGIVEAQADSANNRARVVRKSRQAR
jgi:tetratricopeptide (TPR) repeat protein